MQSNGFLRNETFKKALSCDSQQLNEQATVICYLAAAPTQVLLHPGADLLSGRCPCQALFFCY